MIIFVAIIATMFCYSKDQFSWCTAPGNAQNTTQSAQSVTEFAGNASLHSFDSSDPLCPLQLDAHADWNADTGATTHMTPYHHWLRNYAPKHVAIKLADNNISSLASKLCSEMCCNQASWQQHLLATLVGCWWLSMSLKSLKCHWSMSLKPLKYVTEDY